MLQKRNPISTETGDAIVIKPVNATKEPVNLLAGIRLKSGKLILVKDKSLVTAVFRGVPWWTGG